MPTYDNPIGWGNGFKFGLAVPVDDRMIFDNLVDADAYLSTTQYNVYEGLWAFFIDPGDYYLCQRQDIGIPQDNTSNPYVWKRYSGTLGGLPALGSADQQLVMDADGVASIYDYANQRDLVKFKDAMLVNSSLVVGMLVRQTGAATFEDFHTNTNYPLNNLANLPLYCVFRIVGDDIWVGRQGVVQILGHGVTERVPLYLRTQYQTGGTSYHDNVITNIATTVDGELLSPAGHAIDTNHLFIDLTRNSAAVGTSAGGTGNATIQRDLIQYAGVGGIGVDVDDYFTIPHGFGDQRGMVQIMALAGPPPYSGASGNVKVTADVISYEINAVRIKLDYGAVDQSLVFEVVMIF